MGQGRAMRDYLLKFMNEDAAMGVQFLIALIAVLVLFGIFVWFCALLRGLNPKCGRLGQIKDLSFLIAQL